MMRVFHPAWTICKKDLRVWLRMRVLIIATLLVPCTYLLVEYLGAASVGRSPVAVVNLDRGPAGARVVQAFITADVFRLTQASSSQANILYQQVEVAAIVTIPPDFTQRLQAHLRAPLLVRVNNLNLDLTNDVRRAVPAAITDYYQAQAAGDDPIAITVDDQPLRGADIQLFQYAVLPTILLLVTVNGIITSGLAATLEWEKKTIKHLLLSPGGPTVIILGKVLAGFITTSLLGMCIFSLGAALAWTRPQGLFWFSALVVIALSSLFSSGLGIAIGAFFQRQQPVIFTSTVVSVQLFALAGGVGVIFFEPQWLQTIAAFDPLTYAIHALQMAVFYQTTDQLPRDLCVLSGSALATIGLGLLSLRKRLVMS